MVVMVVWRGRADFQAAARHQTGVRVVIVRY